MSERLCSLLFIFQLLLSSSICSVFYTIFPWLPLYAPSFLHPSTPASELNEVGSVSSRGKGAHWCFSVTNRKWQYIHYLCPHSSFSLTLVPAHTLTHTQLTSHLPARCKLWRSSLIKGTRDTWSILPGFQNHFGPTANNLPNKPKNKYSAFWTATNAQSNSVKVV